MSFREEFDPVQLNIDQERFASACQLLEDLLQKYPEHTPFLSYQLGTICHKKIGDGKKARTYFHAALNGLEQSKGVIQGAMLKQIEANSCENLMLLSLSYVEYDQWADRLEKIQPENPILKGQRPIIHKSYEKLFPWWEVMIWMADGFKPDLFDSPHLGGAASIYRLLVENYKELQFKPGSEEWREVILLYCKAAINIAARSDRTMRQAGLSVDPGEYISVLEVALQMIKQVTADDPGDTKAQSVQEKIVQALKIAQAGETKNPINSQGGTMNQIPSMEPDVVRKGCAALLICSIIGPVLSYFLLKDMSFPSNLLPGLLVGMALGGLYLRVIRSRKARVQYNPIMLTPNMAARPIAMDGWELRMADAVKRDLALEQKLAEVMWLDDYLMHAIRENPTKDHPEMLHAWKLCVQIARELGLPEESGADWVSHQASPIGKSLGIIPRKP